MEIIIKEKRFEYKLVKSDLETKIDTLSKTVIDNLSEGKTDDNDFMIKEYTKFKSMLLLVNRIIEDFDDLLSVIESEVKPQNKMSNLDIPANHKDVNCNNQENDSCPEECNAYAPEELQNER